MKSNDTDVHDDATPTGPPNDITVAEIRAQLQRIIGSRQITKSPRLQAFLEYVVEETLSGRASRIKGFNVAQAVFGGDKDFDPQTNTIVRVEAGRLRRRIAEYYYSEGQDDPVLIDIPKGTYAPVFTRRKTATSNIDADAAEAGPASVPASGQRTAMALRVSVLIAILALAGWWFLGPNSPENKPAIEQLAEPLAKPFVAVLPLDSDSGDPLETRLSAGIAEAIITDLSKLSGLSVMAHASMLELGNRSITVNSIRQEFGATHLIRGSLEREGDTIRVHVQLIDTTTAATIWADRWDGHVADIFELEDKIARQIVAALSIQIAPNERAIFLRRHSSNREAILLFRQGLTMMMAPSDITRILTARQLFQRVSEIDPEFAGGFAGESLSYSVQVAFSKSAVPSKDLELAITLAEKAIEIDADFGMGYASLGYATAFSGRPEEGLTYARQALALQPGDAYSRWMYGVVLILSGDAERAVNHLIEALRLDPAEPRTPYLNVLGVAHFVAGDYAATVDALKRNLERDGPTGPHMDLFLAGAYAELGQEDDAQAVIDRMLLSYPEFPFAAWLSTYLDSESLNKTLNNLYRMGLPRE